MGKMALAHSYLVRYQNPHLDLRERRNSSEKQRQVAHHARCKKKSEKANLATVKVIPPEAEVCSLPVPQELEDHIYQCFEAEVNEPQMKDADPSLFLPAPDHW